MLQIASQILSSETTAENRNSCRHPCEPSTWEWAVLEPSLSTDFLLAFSCPWACRNPISSSCGSNLNCRCSSLCRFVVFKTYSQGTLPSLGKPRDGPHCLRDTFLRTKSLKALFPQCCCSLEPVNPDVWKIEQLERGDTKARQDEETTLMPYSAQRAGGQEPEWLCKAF